VKPWLALVLLAASAGCTGCAGNAEPLGVRTQETIHGSDDRREYFEIPRADVRSLVGRSIVALIPRALLDDSGRAIAQGVTSLREREGLCESVAFAEQPAAAFCSGVLLDEDLVLTAGHCVHQLALRDFRVAFDYFYSAPGALVPDVREPLEIVAEALPRPGDARQLDYAWLRLRAKAAAPPRRPVGVRWEHPALAWGEPLRVISAGGGIPLKIDDGARHRGVSALGPAYFNADSDTLHASSGGGAFDSNLALSGVLTRGGADFVETPPGCRVSAHEANPDTAKETFLHAFEAVHGLCESAPRESALCAPACDLTCRNATRSEFAASAGCAVARRPSAPSAPWSWAFLAAWLAVGRVRTSYGRARR